MILVLEVYHAWDDEVDMAGDNVSDRSKRDFMNSFNDIERENHEKLYAYSVMTVNNSDGTIKYGNFDVKMFQPPINLRKRLQKDQVPNSYVKITL